MWIILINSIFICSILLLLFLFIRSRAEEQLKPSKFKTKKNNFFLLNKSIIHFQLKLFVAYAQTGNGIIVIYVCTSNHFCRLFTDLTIGELGLIYYLILFYFVLFYFISSCCLLPSKSFNYLFIVFRYNEFCGISDNSSNFCQLFPDHGRNRT